MFSFIKTNSYNIFKMMLNQFGLAMFGLVMTMVTVGKKDLSLIMSILCIVFYVYLLYVVGYDMGQRDKPALDGGRAEFKPLKGLWISLCANSINIICGVMAAIFVFFLIPQGEVTIKDADMKPVEMYIQISSGKAEDNTTMADTSVETEAASDSDESFDETSNGADESEPDEIGPSAPEKEEENAKPVYKLVKLYTNNGGAASLEANNEFRRSSNVVFKGLSTYDDDTALYIKDENGEYTQVDVYTKHGATITAKESTAEPDYVESWASNLYSIPLTIAIFLQSMFAGVRDYFAFEPWYFYLFTPILPIIFTALAYYNGAKGKRILFFLPEMKSKPPKR